MKQVLTKPEIGNHLQFDNNGKLGVVGMLVMQYGRQKFGGNTNINEQNNWNSNILATQKLNLKSTDIVLLHYKVAGYFVNNNMPNQHILASIFANGVELADCTSIASKGLDKYVSVQSVAHWSPPHDGEYTIELRTRGRGKVYVGATGWSTAVMQWEVFSR